MTRRPPGWYPGPGLPGRPETAGTVLRWWDGDRWGYDVADLGSHPLFPPPSRRRLPAPDGAEATTVVLTGLPATTSLPRAS
jgi:hypothetical protein